MHRPAARSRRSCRLLVAGSFFALVFAGGCRTTTLEKNGYSLPTEESKNSILDSRLEVLVKEAELYPKRHDLHYSIAGIHFEKTEYHKAERALHRAIELAPTDMKYHFQLGRVYLLMGELEKAKAELERACDVMPKERYSGPHAVLGFTLWKLNEVKRAIEQFEACVRIEPNNASFYYYLGSLHDVLDSDEDVIRYYREYLEKGGRAHRKRALFVLERRGVDVAEIEIPADSDLTFEEFMAEHENVVAPPSDA